MADGDVLTIQDPQVGGLSQAFKPPAALPAWFVADEANQTFDVYGGLHLNSDDAPLGDVTFSIDAREDTPLHPGGGTPIVSITPTVDKPIIDIVVVPAQAQPIIVVDRNGADVFRVQGNGALLVAPAGTTMLQVTALDVDLANSTLYMEPGVVSFFGAGGAGQHAAIADATDPASTMAKLNTLLAYLRLRGDIAT